VIDCDILNFGHGIVFDGPDTNGTLTAGENSSTDGAQIVGCVIQSNVYNGIYVRTTFAIEVSNIVSCHFNGNGSGQNRGAAIQIGGAAAFTVGSCSTTNGSLTVTTSGNFITSGVVVGQDISGTNIPAGATVTRVDSATSLLISLAATGTGSSITMTFSELSGGLSGGRVSGTQASASANFNVVGSTFNVNSNDTLGQIHCPGSAWIELRMSGSTAESQANGRTAIRALSESTGFYNGPRSSIYLNNCNLQQGQSGNREIVELKVGELYASNCRFTFQVPADFTVASCSNTNGTPVVTTSNNFLTAGVRAGMPISGTGMPVWAAVRTVDSATQLTLNGNGTGASGATMTLDAQVAPIKVGLAGQYSSAMIAHCLFQVIGTAANARVLNLIHGAQGNTFWTAFGNTFNNFTGAAAAIMAINNGQGFGDLAVGGLGDYGPSQGTSLRADRTFLHSASDADLKLGFDISRLSGYGINASAFDAGGNGGWLTPVSATGSLPTAGSSNNAKMIIEDTGTERAKLNVYTVNNRYKLRLGPVNQTAPSISANANLGTGGTATVNAGDDGDGKITLATGSSPAAGVWATVTFATAKNAAPRAILLTNGNVSAASEGMYITNITATTFDIGGWATPAGSTSYIMYYHVLE
jgi:hypothetical protein